MIDVDAFIGTKSFKAKGKRISTLEIDTIAFVEPLEKEEPLSEEEVNQDEVQEEVQEEPTTQDIEVKQADIETVKIDEEPDSEPTLF